MKLVDVGEALDSILDRLRAEILDQSTPQELASTLIGLRRRIERLEADGTAGWELSIALRVATWRVTAPLPPF
ncbi:MAG: hypothetical protein ACR2ME_10140 [Acidimicrobiia bacterium]